MELDYEFMTRTLPVIAHGIPITLELTFISLAAAFPFAFLMALARIYRIKGESLVRLYVSVVRGTPIVLQILLIYSVVPSLLNAAVKHMGIPINVFVIPPVFYAYIVFTLNTIALLSEVFRSAFESIDRGQMEAGLSAGLKPMQVYSHVIIPQALVAAMPLICNITVNLLKNTSLAFMMTVKDITGEAKISASMGYNYIEAYLDVWLVYIVLCAAVQILFEAAEVWKGRYRGQES